MGPLRQPPFTGDPPSDPGWYCEVPEPATGPWGGPGRIRFVAGAEPRDGSLVRWRCLLLDDPSCD